MHLPKNDFQQEGNVKAQLEKVSPTEDFSKHCHSLLVIVRIFLCETLVAKSKLHRFVAENHFALGIFLWL